MTNKDTQAPAPTSIAVDQATIARVAAAIDGTDVGFNMSLTRLVDGVSTYTLTMDGKTEEFGDTDDLYARVRETKQRKQAEAVIAALSPAPRPNALASGSDHMPRYTSKRLHDEIAKARAYGLEMAAQLIAANIIQDTSRGKVLSPRQEGNCDGLHYAAEIRHLAAAVDAKERKE